MDKRSLLFILALTASIFFVNQWTSKKVEQPQHPIAQVVEEVKTETSSPQISRQGEELYVLENSFQQVVFSTLGGAVAEINLPFKTEENAQSIVLPISFDKTMEKDYPYNDHFPQRSYRIVRDQHQEQIAEGTLGGYYPLLRRSVLGNSGHPIHPLSPRYFAFNILNDEETLFNQPYQVTHFDKEQITFSYSDNYRKITKTFRLSAESTPYCLELEIKIEGDARGLWLTTGVPEVELISGNFSPMLKYLIQKNQGNQVETLSLPKDTIGYSSINPNWISNSNGFLGVITEPITTLGNGFRTGKIPGTLAPTKLSLIDSQNNLYPLDKYPGYETLLPLRPSSSAPLKIRIFAGPYQDSLLKEVDITLAKTQRNPDFTSALSFQGWFSFISEPFAKFLFFLMNCFYQFTHSWGISIILLTVALRVMLYPLNGWSIKSSLKLQQIAPQITAIQEKYKKDPKRAQMEIVTLYREKKVNPFSGCLPILIQIPFLIGMFDLLKSVFELRGAPLIPGWIDNLTAPDVLFSWNYPLFFFGTNFHLLPILLGALMYLQQKIAANKTKGQLLTDAQKQQKVMGNVLVIVFAVMFYHFPSGLNIYWLSSTLLQILQQWMMTKNLKKT